ncbi:MAG: alanine-zipper protein [Inquilinaceae bacterium]
MTSVLKTSAMALLVTGALGLTACQSTMDDSASMTAAEQSAASAQAAAERAADAAERAERAAAEASAAAQRAERMFNQSLSK